MKWLAKTLCAGAMFVALMGTSQAVLIGFEGLANGTVITNQFAGVTFSANAGFENQVTTQPGIGFGDNFICTAPTGGFINCVQETILTFVSPVNNVSFWQVGDDALGVVGLVDVFTGGVFNTTVNILGFDNFVIPNLVDLSGFLNVSSLRIYNITDPGGLGFDNFSFDTTVIPVPAALPLFGTALAAMGFIGWRRKRKTAA